MAGETAVDRLRTVVWFRGKDLRVTDHAPLREAAAAGDVIPLFILDDHFFSPARARETPHRIQFLLESLRELDASIGALGSRLLIVPGRSVEVVPRLARAWGAHLVSAYDWAAPIGRERDRRVADRLSMPLQIYGGETLLTPGSLRTGAGEPYSVFTPFSRAFTRAMVSRVPHRAPAQLPPLPADVVADTMAVPSCESLGVTPNPGILRGGEKAARGRARHFFEGPASRYQDARNRLDQEGTSRLSADLKFGTVSALSVWAWSERLRVAEAKRAFQNELIWREFCHSTIADRPELETRPFRAEFEDFPWESHPDRWDAWVNGTTGYPVVDASARQLLGEGFVHNRARMISASFLTKHLMIDYRRGEAHYMRFLTDGDWANNNAGWQWSAGCGADAQPYFRIFNPVTQGRTFDPDGTYVRRWVPELANLDTRFIHAPWQAPADTLSRAGVRLGHEYPDPIVDHKDAREYFLGVAAAHLRKMRGRGR